MRVVRRRLGRDVCARVSPKLTNRVPKRQLLRDACTRISPILPRSHTHLVQTGTFATRISPILPTTQHASRPSWQLGFLPLVPLMTTCHISHPREDARPVLRHCASPSEDVAENPIPIRRPQLKKGRHACSPSAPRRHHVCKGAYSREAALPSWGHEHLCHAYHRALGERPHGDERHPAEAEARDLAKQPVRGIPACMPRRCRKGRLPSRFSEIRRDGSARFSRSDGCPRPGFRR